MPLRPTSPTAAQLYRIGRSVLPRFLFAADGPATFREWLWGAARMWERVGQQVDYWIGQTYVGESDGAWTDAHLADRASTRRAGEDDVTARERARTIPDAATVPALTAIADAILIAGGVAGRAAIVPLRRRGLHWGRGYWSRGYRYTQEQPSTVVVILPFGTPPAVAAAVAEAMRQREAAGQITYVEVRRIP